ncbi:MAG: hypothetical protein GX102_03365 [Porphyromonadaceae bacterium]|nr:hypothetical protein [Porphyromonadaceae bacterium]
MKILFLLPLLFVFACSQGQQSTKGKVENYSGGVADVMLSLFEGESPFKVGAISKDGSLTIDLDLYSEQLISDIENSKFTDPFAYSFQYICEDIDNFPQFDNQPNGKNIGHFEIWQNSEWQDNLFAADNKELRYWIQNPAYLSAVKGSFFQVTLSTQDIDMRHTCSNTDFYDNTEEITVEIEYDLILKKGLNLIEYEILEVHQPSSTERGAFPVKVRVKNPGENAAILWFTDSEQT